MPVAAIGAAVAIGGLIASKVGGVGKNDTRVKRFNETSAYDPNAQYYGRDPNAAGADATRFTNLASQAANRAPPHASFTDVDYKQADQSRAQQSQAAGLMMQRAQGLVPSIASQQATLDMQRATAAQASASGSARGAAGLALAGQNAANNTATMQSAISNQAQVNGAQERLAAEQSAYGAYGGLRQGDQAQAQFTTQNAVQQDQYNAQLRSQRNAQNDAYSLGLYNNAQNVREMQLRGGLGTQQVLAGDQASSAKANADISQRNSDREFDYLKMIGGAASGGMSAASQPTGIGSDDRMKMGMMQMGGSTGSMPIVDGVMPGSFEAGAPGGGTDPMATARKYNGVVMNAMANPGYQSGLLSDEHAKQEMFALGVKQGRADVARDEVQQIDHDRDRIAASREDASREWARDLSHAPMVGSPLGAAMVAGPMIYNMLADRQEAQSMRTGDRGLPDSAVPGAADLARGEGRAVDPNGVGTSAYVPANRRGDPVTAQFAEGLSPIRFQYKPGMGPGGEQTGVRAQAAADQPITSSMITRRPDGLLQIDPNMGLSTALAGVGHLAKKQEENEAKLNGLLARSAVREGY